MKDEQVLNSFHEAGFFHELKVETNKHNKLDKKAIDNGSSLIVFWIWRKEARTTKSLLDKYGAKN